MRCRCKVWCTTKFQPLLPNRALLILLKLALLVFGATTQAQEIARQHSDGTIAGIVSLPGDNQPASKVTVSLRSAGVFRTVLTDDDGHFEVPGLPPGKYEISIAAQNYLPYQSIAQFDGAHLRLEFHLEPAARLSSPPDSGTVTVRELMIPSKARDEYSKGLMNLKDNQLEKGLKHFAGAIRAFPGFYEAYYHQGIAEASLGHNEAALRAFQTALSLSGGQYAQAHFGIAYIYCLEGHAAQAETITRRGLQLDPNSPNGHVILGMVLLKLNRTDEAEKTASEALLRNPNEALAYLVLADVCSRRHNYQEEVQHLDTYLRLNPNGLPHQHVRDVRDAALKIVNALQTEN